MHHIVQEYWDWSVEKQTHIVLTVHAGDCIGCKLGIPDLELSG